RSWFVRAFVKPNHSRCAGHGCPSTLPPQLARATSRCPDRGLGMIADREGPFERLLERSSRPHPIDPRSLRRPSGATDSRRGPAALVAFRGYAFLLTTCLSPASATSP